MDYTIFTKTGLIFVVSKIEYQDKGVRFENDDEYFVPYENIDYIIK